MKAGRKTKLQVTLSSSSRTLFELCTIAVQIPPSNGIVPIYFRRHWREKLYQENWSMTLCGRFPRAQDSRLSHTNQLWDLIAVSCFCSWGRHCCSWTYFTVWMTVEKQLFWQKQVWTCKRSQSENITAKQFFSSLLRNRSVTILSMFKP